MSESHDDYVVNPSTGAGGNNGGDETNKDK